MKKQVKKIAFFLAICMTLSVFAGFAPAFAAEQPEQTDGAQESAALPETIGGVTVEKQDSIAEFEENLYTKVFHNEDGTNTLYVYDCPVKYVTDGKIKDISLNVTKRADGSFVSADHMIQATFSKELSDGISLAYNDIDIALLPEGVSGISAISDGNKVSYALDSKTLYEYSLTYTGFKEDIVVSEYTGQTEYTFVLETDGLALTDDFGTYVLVDESGAVKASLSEIILFTADERNNAFGSMHAETIEENQSYLLTIELDESWLSDPNTLYPITIDPSIFLNTVGEIEDVSIVSTTTHSGASGSLYVGRGSSGAALHTLMRFPYLDIGNKGYNITNATVSIRDIMCESTTQTVECYEFMGGIWSEGTTTTWDSVGDYHIGRYLSSNEISYANGVKLDERHRYEFDITSLAQKWANGAELPSGGIVFKSTSDYEENGSKTYRTFASINRGSNPPRLVIEYIASVSIDQEYVAMQEGTSITLKANISGISTTTAWSSGNNYVATVNAYGKVTAKGAGKTTISVRIVDTDGEVHTSECEIFVYLADGLYYFNNVANSYRVDHKGGYIDNYTTVQLWNSGTNEPTNRNQLFKIKYIGNELYTIRSMVKSDMGWYVYGSRLCVTSIGTSDSVSPNAKWKINSDRNGYYITSGDRLFTTVTSPQSVSNGTGVTLSTYSVSDKYQHWTMKRSTASYHGVNIRNCTDNMVVGDEYKFTASMYSSNIDSNEQNGVTWSVTNGSGSATIGATTGVLTGVSYPHNNPA